MDAEEEPANKMNLQVRINVMENKPSKLAQKD